MRKQTRPFAVEIKRTKGSRQPSPFLELPKEPGAPKREMRQVPDAFVLSPSEPAGPAPRILESSTPGWSPPPTAEDAAKPKRGRPRKVRPDVAAAAERPAMTAPEDRPEPRTDETPADVSESEPDDRAEPVADRPAIDTVVPTQTTVRRRSRRPTEGHIGERWKRHLPRWKR